MEDHLEAVGKDVVGAQSDAQERLKEISGHKEVYLEASHRCKEAEKVITEETSNVEELRVKLEEVMDRVRAYVGDIHMY